MLQKSHSQPPALDVYFLKWWDKLLQPQLVIAGCLPTTHEFIPSSQKMHQRDSFGIAFLKEFLPVGASQPWSFEGVRPLQGREWFKFSSWRVEPTHLKNMHKSKWVHLPPSRGEHRKYLSCHHLEYVQMVWTLQESSDHGQRFWEVFFCKIDLTVFARCWSFVGGTKWTPLNLIPWQQGKTHKIYKMLACWRFKVDPFCEDGPFFPKESVELSHWSLGKLNLNTQNHTKKLGVQSNKQKSLVFWRCVFNYLQL